MSDAQQWQIQAIGDLARTLGLDASTAMQSNAMKITIDGARFVAEIEPGDDDIVVALVHAVTNADIEPIGRALLGACAHTNTRFFTQVALDGAHTLVLVARVEACDAHALDEALVYLRGLYAQAGA